MVTLLMEAKDFNNTVCRPLCLLVSLNSCVILSLPLSVNGSRIPLLTTRSSWKRG